MSKVFCAAIECKHNEKNICRKKQINLSSSNIATVNEGRKDVWLCRMYEMSEEAKQMYALVELMQKKE